MPAPRFVRHHRSTVLVPPNHGGHAPDQTPRRCARLVDRNEVAAGSAAPGLRCGPAVGHLALCAEELLGRKRRSASDNRPAPVLAQGVHSVGEGGIVGRRVRVECVDQILANSPVRQHNLGLGKSRGIQCLPEFDGVPHGAVWALVPDANVIEVDSSDLLHAADPLRLVVDVVHREVARSVANPPRHTPRQPPCLDRRVAALGFGEQPRLVPAAAIEVVSGVHVGWLGSGRGLHVPANLHLENVERGPEIWSEEVIEDLATIRFGVIDEPTRRCTRREKTVPVKRVATRQAVQRERQRWRRRRRRRKPERRSTRPFWRGSKRRRLLTSRRPRNAARGSASLTRRFKNTQA
eukprot:m.148055 g.148055  ORF g.148055 m.148055 type:complete len:350 (-) comp14201_c0_seq3:310-1359(-)